MLLLVTAMIATHRAGVPTALTKKVDEMQPGWVKHVGMAVLAWMAPADMVQAGASSSTTPLPPPRPTTIGMNAPAISFSASTVPFANLVMGSDWLDSHWQKLTDQFQDGEGNIRALPADGTALHFLSIPPTGLKGIEVRCTFTGSGTLSFAGAGQLVASGANLLRLRVVNRRGEDAPPFLILKNVDPQRPPRDLDCRDARLDRNVRFRPEFVDTLRGYGVIRFMDWQNANANEAVSWRERHVPAGNRTDRDGVAIEDMLALVRELNADPWFVMPWNADNEYIVGFARLVKAALPEGRHVYVEVGNEVWNTGFPVAQQAVKEGTERKFGTDVREAGMRRYAERTVEVMRLWEPLFANRGGLVRVLSSQHVVPYSAQIALSFRDTAAHVDALATAPYFGATLGGTGNTRESAVAHLRAELPVTLGQAKENRRLAASFSKRYIGYEGGQGLVLPAQLPLAEQLQHDPVMYDLYRQYLAGWQREIGDTLCLLTSVAKSGPYGSWGLAAWEDETPEQAPKLRAVRDFLGLSRSRPIEQPIASGPRG